MIAVSEENEEKDLKDPANMEPGVLRSLLLETIEASAEEETKEKAPEKEGFLRRKKDPKDKKKNRRI